MRKIDDGGMVHDKDHISTSGRDTKDQDELKMMNKWCDQSESNVIIMVERSERNHHHQQVIFQYPAAATP